MGTFGFLLGCGAHGCSCRGSGVGKEGGPNLSICTVTTLCASFGLAELGKRCVSAEVGCLDTGIQETVNARPAWIRADRQGTDEPWQRLSSTHHKQIAKSRCDGFYSAASFSMTTFKCAVTSLCSRIGTANSPRVLSGS